MQFTQPTGFYNNYGQPIAFNPPFQFGYPEVIGEGNVTSIMSPDGSINLLFLPTAQWWRPYPCNINVGNVNNPNWNPTGAWFIRNVLSPLQHSMTCQPQPFQCSSSIALPRDGCESVQSCRPPGFELKFHNDICTSTSDIHYFYPSMKPCDWLKNPKKCPSVQLVVPMATNTYADSFCRNEVACTKPCDCAPINDAENTARAKCSCAKTSDSSISDMSCDAKPGKHCWCHKDRKKSRREKKKNKPKKNKVICECKQQNTTDKVVTTFSEQASGCAAEKGCETQTACGKGRDTQTASRKGRDAQTACGKEHDSQTACGSILVRKVKSEVKTENRKTRKAMKIKSSENFLGSCESGCCSGTCSCHSYTS